MRGQTLSNSFNVVGMLFSDCLQCFNPILKQTIDLRGGGAVVGQRR